MKRLSIIFIIILFFFCDCSRNYAPKPRGYQRFDFPPKEYELFDNNFPYSFEFPNYGKMVRDTDKNAEPYWMNIEFKHYKAKIHLSYKKINKDVSIFIEDAHTLAYKHSVKADAIDEELITNKNSNVYGLLFDIRGNTASSVQFYLTDSIRNFLRGSLYFDSQPNKDSLAPAIEFFRKDILHLIETLKWKTVH